MGDTSEDVSPLSRRRAEKPHACTPTRPVKEGERNMEMRKGERGAAATCGEGAEMLAEQPARAAVEGQLGAVGLNARGMAQRKAQHR